ncbi:hypothetical protein, partial [Geobacillus sp. 47C-IIb]|uniref:hypothetical protein n=1 Tax=Geobacillus sp. 47C-IIb TaxID=1963026 RepID=UPI001E4C161D
PILPTFFENIVYLWNKMGFRHSSETHFVNSLRQGFSLVFFYQAAGGRIGTSNCRLAVKNRFHDEVSMCRSEKRRRNDIEKV